MVKLGEVLGEVGELGEVWPADSGRLGLSRLGEMGLEARHCHIKPAGRGREEGRRGRSWGIVSDRPESRPRPHTVCFLHRP